MTPPSIIPVILSGGAGVRLWPLSRPDTPKQLIPLVDERTMLLATIIRLEGIEGLAPPVVICNAAHVADVWRDLVAAGHSDGRVIVEPVGRNTAPAVAASALTATGDDPLLLVMPADHLVRDAEAFRSAVAIGTRPAQAGKLVTFGIVATYPATGYGYIKATGSDDVRLVERFVEKPGRELAERFFASGEYLWNSGMFMFTAAQFSKELRRYTPAVLEATNRAVTEGVATPDGELLLDATAFSEAPSISIDYAVMEHTDHAVVVPLDAGWTDLGSWDSLHGIGAADEDGNVTAGNVVIRKVANSYVRSEGPLVAATGVEDLVIVATSDAVLVTNRGDSDNLKGLVEALTQLGRAEATSSPSHRHSWGTRSQLMADGGGTVDRFEVAAGASLDLDPGTWVVVSGEGATGESCVVVGDVIQVPAERAVALRNVGDDSLVAIVVRSTTS